MLPTKTNRDTLTIHQKKKQPPRTMETYDVCLLLLLLLFLSVLFAKLRILSIEISVFYFYFYSDATQKKKQKAVTNKMWRFIHRNDKNKADRRMNGTSKRLNTKQTKEEETSSTPQSTFLLVWGFGTIYLIWLPVIKNVNKQVCAARERRMRRE